MMARMKVDRSTLMNMWIRLLQACTPLPTRSPSLPSLPTVPKMRLFMATGCGCAKQCSKQFSQEYMTSVRGACEELTHGELDMAILGQLMASQTLAPQSPLLQDITRLSSRGRTLPLCIKASQCVLAFSDVPFSPRNWNEEA